MNDGLFIAIYLDEDVHILVGDLLTRRGFRAITARDADQLGKSDAEQLAFATSQGRAILTHNRRDFEVTVQTGGDERPLQTPGYPLSETFA